MAQAYETNEHLLAVASEGDERRSVTLVEGGSLVLMERSSGPVTEAAYGVLAHAHKMLFDAAEAGKALGVEAAGAMAALEELFADPGEAPLLSEVMDRFDAAGARYTYVSWTDGGDVAFRADCR